MRAHRHSFVLRLNQRLKEGLEIHRLLSGNSTDCHRLTPPIEFRNPP
jgi:hypothetical protein